MNGPPSLPHHISVTEVADKIQTPRNQRSRMSLSRNPTNYPVYPVGLGRDSGSQFYENPHRANRFGGRKAQTFWSMPRTAQPDLFTR